MKYMEALFAVVCVLLVLACIIGLIIERVRDWRLDRDIRRAFKEADRLGLLRKYK